jgi:Cu/Ag efflux pump CusA
MLRARRLVAAVAAVLIVVGILTLRSAHVDVLPEFQPPTVDVQTEALGLSSTEVEQLITVPLEQDLLNGVAWLNTIESESVPGMSSIHLTFDAGTNLYKARQLVQERLSQTAGLPNVSKPPQMLQPMSSTSRVMMLGLSSKGMSLIKMSVLARWTIVPKLMGVPGVSNVATWGQRDQQLQVQVDPQRLRENNVTLLDVITTTGNALWYSPLTFVEASTPGTGGFIDTSNQRLTVMHLSPITTPEELAQVALAQGQAATLGDTSFGSEQAANPTNTSAATGKTLRLGDVANVVEDHQPLIGDAVLTNGPGLLLVIDKSPGADVYQVTRGIQEAMQELQPGLSDIQVDYNVFRPATYIEHGLSNLVIGLIISGVLILLSLGAFFFDWRSVVVAAVVIAVSLAVAVLLLRLFGEGFNWMSLAGLVIGLVLVIDVVMSCVKNIRRRLRESGESADHVTRLGLVVEAVRDMRSIAVYTLIMVLVTLLPIFSARGATAGLVRSLSLSFVLVVVVSTAAALVLTPALALMFLPKAGRPLREAVTMQWVRARYERSLVWMAKSSRRWYIPVIAIVVIAAAMLPFLREGLIPVFKDTSVFIQFTAQPGTSLPEMSRVVGLVGDELKGLPGVKDVSGHIGRAVLGDQVVNVNAGVVWLDIAGAKDYEKTLAAIAEVAHGYPGLEGKVLTYPNSRIANEEMGPQNQVTIRIYGQDLGTLQTKADEVSKAVSSIKGVAATSVEKLQEEPGLDIEVNLAAAQKYGIKPGDVRRAAAAFLSGIQVGSLFEENKVFDVVVWGTPETRADFSTIRNLLLQTPSGTVKLSDVADVTIAPNPSVIQHDAVSRKIDVTVTANGRSAGSIADDIENRLANVSFPLEYRAEVIGSYDEIEAIHAWMLVLGLAAVLGLFLLMQAALASWRLALLAFVCSLAAVTGSAAASFFLDRSVSPAIFLGWLAVFGIAVRNNILLMRDCRDCQLDYEKAESPDRPMRPIDFMVDAASRRFSPLVMTIVTAGLALLPLAMLGNVAGLEVLHKPVIAVLGGLVTLAFVNLYVTPALYLRFGRAWRKQNATS